jgi:hypothetical protein
MSLHELWQDCEGKTGLKCPLWLVRHTFYCDQHEARFLLIYLSASKAPTRSLEFARQNAQFSAYFSAI